MQFLTTEYVAEQAKLGKRPALECSWEHHHQGETADYEDLIKAVIDEEYAVHVDFCSCCQLYDFKNQGRGACKKCPLDEDGQCCNGLWVKLDNVFGEFLNDLSLGNAKSVQDAESKICAYIEGVLEKKRAEKKTESVKAKQKMEDHQKTEQGQCCTCEYETGQPQHCRDSNKHFCNCSGWQAKESTPTLRAGDYGYMKDELNKNKQDSFIIYGLDGSDVLYRQGNRAGRSRCGWKYFENINLIIILGNIFDDLAQRAEDRTEFDISDVYGRNYSIQFSTDMSEVWIKKYGQTKGIAFKTGMIIEAYKNLGQMLATQIRKWGKGK